MSVLGCVSFDLWMYEVMVVFHLIRTATDLGLLSNLFLHLALSNKCKYKFKVLILI